MKSKVIPGLFLLILTSLSVPGRAQTKPVAIRIADIDRTDVGGEYAGLKLDELADRISRSPESQGALIVYGPEGTGPGTGNFYLESVTNYLRLGKPNRVKSIYGGLGKSLTEIRLEIWLVPPGAEFPTLAVNKIDLDHLSGLVVRRQSEEGWFSDPPNGPAPREIERAAFAQVLHHQPNSTGFIVTHSSKEPPGYWRRSGQYEIQQLAQYGIPVDRLKIINGSGDDLNEFWVLPNGERPPVKEAEPYRLSSKAVLIRNYEEYQLSESGYQDFAFNAYADLFKDYPDSKICFMIMPPDPNHKSTDKSDPPNPFSVDFHALVEKWRSRFASELKINPNRIVVLSPKKAKNDYQGKMFTWVVPKNAALPSLKSLSD